MTRPTADDLAAAERVLLTGTSGFPKTALTGIMGDCVICAGRVELNTPTKVGATAAVWRGICPTCGSIVFARDKSNA